MKIASLGLLNQEKKLIEDYILEHYPFLSNRNINWFPITNPDLKVIILRASFLVSFNVKAYLSHVTRAVTILSVCKSQDDLALSQKHNILAINLLESSSQNIKNWISQIIHSQVIDMHHSYLDSAALKDVNAINNIEDVREFFSVIDQNNRIIYLKTKENDSLWINGQTGLVHSTLEKDDLPDITHFLWKEEATEFNIDSILTLDCQVNLIRLDEWVWEVIWKSDLDFSELISKKMAYQLVKWPHFCQKSKVGRSDALRLSARLNKKAIIYDDLLKDSGHDRHIINLFIYSMLSIKFIKMVSLGNNEIATVLDSHSKQNDMGLERKKSFLNQIRKIIGL